MVAAVSRSRWLALASASLAALSLAACDGGVELNGKLFDALGVSEAAQKNSKTEPKLKERTGLVVPPNVNRLPEPGSGTAGEPDLAQQVADPDRKRVMAAAERERLHKAYCSGDMNWKQRVGDRDAATKAPTSPYGPCGGLSGAFNQ